MKITYRGRISRAFLGTEAFRITQFLADGIGARVAGSGQERAAADFVSHTFRSMGYQTAFQDFETPDGSQSRNVLATKSHAFPERFLVVGAHYDSVKDTPGANDNASGVGVMVETAICLSGLELTVPVVYVAFGSEEGSHAGSKHFVSALGSRVMGMINLDAVGVDAGMEIACYGEADPWLAKQCRGTAEFLGFELSASNFGGKSDYASFADAGIPVACFARTDQPNAHTPDDNMSIISAPAMAQVGQVLVNSLIELRVPRRFKTG
ncbi:MAG TPA: M28 family peptidase [Armatimonadota bacterium]|nr:M28 family peptidase [Armatimonadota bacterium]